MAGPAVLKLLGRYWRGLFAARTSSQPDFNPREGEVVHAQGPARGYDEGREVNLGEGRLLVTSNGLVYLADTGKWRFHWHHLAQVTLEDDRSLAIETRSGSRYVFRLPSVQEAEAMLQAIASARESAQAGEA